VSPPETQLEASAPEDFVMRRATGRGQIEPHPIRVPAAGEPGTVPVVAVRLFNFDIDDDTVKEDHRNWLKDNVVTAFKKSSDSEVLLQGTSSQSGANDYNLQLSKRRVEAVKRFLTSQGVPAGGIDTSFTGEELSTSTSSEDPRDRAVVVVLEPGQITPVRFRQHAKLDGFEASTSPNRMDSLLLAVGDLKQVDIDDPEAVGFLLTQHPAFATPIPAISPIVNPFRVRGVGAGATVLEAWDPGRTLLMSEMEVIVKPAKTLRIAFHIVSDTAGHSTRRGSSNINDNFNAVNNVYFPQSGLRFVWDGSVKVIRVPFDLGPKVEAVQGKGGRDWDAIVAQGDKTANVRVYFVHDFDFTDTEKEELGGADPSGDCMIGDDTPVNLELKTIAHEIGHCLGLEHQDNDDFHLMSTSRTNPGLVIDHQEADIINPFPRPTTPRPRLHRR
jgi:outer membrane protein OmpA-like peptidoglycan-associated protein